jgi:hypothetical protein
MADQSQQGPLTLEQILQVWQSSADSTYTQPLLAAGNGAGLEVYSQLGAQLARVSLAADRTFSSMYALPWSGQTNPSASGATNATATISFTRSRRLSETLVLGQGWIWIDELATDASPSGPVQVSTGRRYLLLSNVVFLPGEQGPWTADVVAEKPGLNYSDPTPNSLTLIEEPGSGRSNELATVAIVLAPVPPAPQVPAQTVTLTSDDVPDMFTPDELGQYVGFTAGANAGLSGRIVQFVPAPSTGGGTGVVLEQMVVVLVTVTSGTFDPTLPDPVTVLNGATMVGSGTLLAARVGPGGYCLAFSLTSGASAPAIGYTVEQVQSASTASSTVVQVFQGGQYTAEAPSGTPETGGASWEILDWVDDWGLSATNPASPEGGSLATLDALGQEKDLPRLVGEPDGAYALRITQIADKVTPNAIRRSLVRTVGPTGWCFREVESALLPGFFFDRTDDGGDAWDYGTLLFSGSYPGGVFFEPGEPVRYMSGLSVVAEGYWGSFCAYATATNPSGYAPASYQSPSWSASAGAAFTLVLAPGRYSTPMPTISVQAGDQIVGTVSGCVFDVTATVANQSANTLRWHCWLDYTQFRAFFIAQVPTEGEDDFGFSWDMTAPYGLQVSAYDLTGTRWLNFFDGYPYGNSPYYTRIYNDLLNVIAGGVGFDLEQANSQPCV